MVKEQRKLDRRDFSYYMPIKDADSSEQVGVMTDISLAGFKLESQLPFPSGQVNQFRLDLSYDIAPRAALFLMGRSRWCHPDNVDPSRYNVGFEIMDMPPDEKAVLQQVFERYGSQTKANGNNNEDYLWK